MSIPLLTSMPSVLNFTGDKISAAGYYGHTKGLHTIVICVHNFQGRISIQGSMVIDPTENDWFVIPYPEKYSAKPYIEYPRILKAPNPNTPNGENSTFGFSFKINCIWLRAVVSRDYLFSNLSLLNSSINREVAISHLGHVDSIFIKY